MSKTDWKKFLRKLGIAIVIAIIIVPALALGLQIIGITSTTTQIALYGVIVAIIAIANSNEHYKQSRYESQLRGLIDNFLKISETNDSFIKEFKDLATLYKTNQQDCTKQMRDLYAKYNLSTFCLRIVLIGNHITDFKDQSVEEKDKCLNILKSTFTRTDYYKIFFAFHFAYNEEFARIIEDNKLLDNLNDSIRPTESVYRMNWYSIFDDNN